MPPVKTQPDLPRGTYYFCLWIATVLQLHRGVSEDMTFGDIATEARKHGDTKRRGETGRDAETRRDDMRAEALAAAAANPSVMPTDLLRDSVIQWQNAHMYDTSFRRLAFGVAGALFVISFAASAQRGQAPATNSTPAQPANATPAQPAGGGPGGAPPPRPILPASASSIAAKPENFYGQVVSIYATVEQAAIAPTAFSVDQDKTKSTGQEVVVLAPRLHEAVQPNTYVTVIGEVVHADAGEIAKKARPGTPPLPADVLSRYQGKPVILATAVINGAFTDLARYIPPPMTPEEAVLDKAMKSVGQANGALRKGVDAANAELVKTNTAILAKAFAETETFWKGRGNAEAVKIAQTARAAVAAIESAAGMGNWNEAKAQNTTLGQQCAGCHVYRERGEDGSYFVKKTQ